MTNILTPNKNSSVKADMKPQYLYENIALECPIKPLEVNVRVTAKPSNTIPTAFFKPKSNAGKSIGFLSVGNMDVRLSDYDRKALIANKGEILFQNKAYTFHYNGFDTITAYCLKTLEEVGEIKFNQRENDVYVWLDYIEVNRSYQRLGIGTNLLKAALLVEPELQIASNSILNSKKPSNACSGYALIKHCISIGLLDIERNFFNTNDILTNSKSKAERTVMCL